MNDEDLSDHLRRLEGQLLDPNFRRDSGRVEALLDEEFCEFGASGRVWTRAEILLLLMTEKNYETPTIEAFHVREISVDAALVTYRAVSPSRTSLRSSLWKLQATGWRMVFHQGTLAVPDPG